MLPGDQNDLLTRCGPVTRMGTWIRRYWVPALLSEEIPEPDGAPVRVRLLGEELIAFRDSRGRIGLLEEHCAHRGTSLVYGRNEDCGLRCIYHGWKFDVEGRVLDTPAEPPDSDFKQRVRLAAYPCHEVAGVIFAYLGPSEHRPLFPAYAWTQVPQDHVYVTKCMLDCNYLQGLEGECDSAHLSFLHREFEAGGFQEIYRNDTAPAYATEETDFGVRLIAQRALPDGRGYVRVSHYVAPVSCWVPAGGRREVHMYVPADDTHTWRYDLGYLDRPVRPEDVHRRRQIGLDYRRVRTAANGYLQDRELQRTADYTGIEDFLNEDACATESMGAVFDRPREHLGVSDKGVIAVRHFLLRSLREFAAGSEPPHLVRDPRRNDFRHLDTVAGVMPVGQTWRQAFPHIAPTGLAAGAASDRS